MNEPRNTSLEFTNDDKWVDMTWDCEHSCIKELSSFNVIELCYLKLLIQSQLDEEI